MTPSSHIRRIALIAVIGCAILVGWTSAAVARPIDDPALPNSPTAPSTTEPRVTSSGDSSDFGLPIALVVLVGVGTAGYAFRTRTSRRAVA